MSQRNNIINTSYLPWSGEIWHIDNDTPNTAPLLTQAEYEEQEPLLYNHKGEPLYRAKEPIGFRMGND